MVESLNAWLDAFGDVGTAVIVHSSTFRYRLRRLSEVGEIDLTDPNAQLAAIPRLWRPLRAKTQLSQTTGDLS